MRKVRFGLLLLGCALVASLWAERPPSAELIVGPVSVVGQAEPTHDQNRAEILQPADQVTKARVPRAVQAVELVAIGLVVGCWMAHLLRWYFGSLRLPGSGRS